MEYIISLDTELFFFLNNLHTPWLDVVIFYLSKTVAWLPLYVFLLYLIITRFGKRSWIPVACIAFCIICTDQITSSIMKPSFERLRPSHEPALQGKVHLVKEYRGGKYGFASSHAANTFGIAFFIFLLLRTHYRWMETLFIWAFIVSYTRIYLGVHYPGDIVVGAVIGLLFGLAIFRLNLYIQQKTDFGKT